MDDKNSKNFNNRALGVIMNDLPKELTPELLELITKDYVQTLEIVDNEVHYSVHGVAGYKAINIDTLTRLMKEWCFDKGYSLETRFNYPLQQVSMTNNGGLARYSSPAMSILTELEAVLKATHWLAKEKGLI